MFSSPISHCIDNFLAEGASVILIFFRIFSERMQKWALTPRQKGQLMQWHVPQQRSQQIIY